MLLALACTTTTKKDLLVDQQEKVHQVVQEQDKADTVETKTQAASEVDTKITKENEAVEVEAPDGEITIAVVTAKAPLRLVKGSKVIGSVPLVKYEDEQKKDIGAKVDQKAAEVNLGKTTDTDKAKTTHKVDKEEKVQDIGPGWKFYAWITGTILLVLAGAGCYLKFVLKPPWLPGWL